MTSPLDSKNQESSKNTTIESLPNPGTHETTNAVQNLLRKSFEYQFYVPKPSEDLTSTRSPRSTSGLGTTLTSTTTTTTTSTTTKTSGTMRTSTKIVMRQPQDIVYADIPSVFRTFLQDVPYHEGMEIHINGYIDSKRKQKEIIFIIIRDETASVQILLPKKKIQEGKLPKIQLDIPLYVKGRVIKSEKCQKNYYTSRFMAGYEIEAEHFEITGPPVHNRCLQCNVKISRGTNKQPGQVETSLSKFCVGCAEILHSISNLKNGTVTNEFKILEKEKKICFPIKKVLSGCIEIGDSVFFRLDSNNCATDIVSVKPWPVFQASKLFWAPPTIEKEIRPGEKRVLIIYSGGTFGTLRNKNGEFSQPSGGGGDVFKELKKYPVFSKLRLEDDSTVESNLVFYSIKFPIDSTEATPQSWNLLSEVINSRKKIYSGFVVIHGTDTLTYTAAALSFMLAHISCPVVITGAQTSVFSSEYMVNDALMNLQGSVALVYEDVRQRNGPKIPLVGTFTYFSGKVMLGSRVVKISSSSYEAFDSPNAAVLGHVKPEYTKLNVPTHFVLDTLKLKALNEERAILRKYCRKLVEPSMAANANSDLGYCPELDNIPDGIDLQKGRTFGYMVSFNTNLEPSTFLQPAHVHIRVYILRLAPGCQSDIPILESALLQYHGVIVLAYGSGNAPKKIIDLLTKIRMLYRIPVAFITECHHGGTATVYDVAIPRIAAISCRDMTLPAAYTRMFLALSFQAFVKTSNKSPLELRTVEIRDEVEANMAIPVLDCFTRVDDEEAHCRQVVAM